MKILKNDMEDFGFNPGWDLEWRSWKLFLWGVFLFCFSIVPWFTGVIEWTKYFWGLMT